MYNMGSNSLVHNLTPIKYNVTRLTINATLKCWINTILGWKPVLIIGHAVNFMHVKETNKSQIFIYFSSFHSDPFKNITFLGLIQNSWNAYCNSSK